MQTPTAGSAIFDHMALSSFRKLKLRGRLPYAIRLWLLQRSRDAVNRSYEADIKRARDTKAGLDKLNDLSQQQASEDQFASSEIAILMHERLSRIAERNFLPLPPFTENDEKWAHHQDFGRWTLSKSAMADLRTAIRNERKERREAWAFWVTVLTAIIGAVTGLIGALIGFYSLHPPPPPPT